MTHHTVQTRREQYLLSRERREHWQQPFDDFLNHTSTCRHCHPVSGRYCEVAELMKQAIERQD